MKTKYTDYIFAGLFAGVIGIFAQITVPLPLGVPLTLQTFAVTLCGYYLKTKFAVLSVVVYITIGTLGLPVFSAFTGGPAVLFGRSGGFLFGFIIMVFFCGISSHCTRKPSKIIFGTVGLFLCHIVGILHYSAVTSGNIFSSMIICSLPYIPKDIISLILAQKISDIIKIKLS